MFIERLMNQTNAPLVERVLQFASARHSLIAENIANVDTPGYRQKDLSQAKFFAMLRERAATRAQAAPGTVTFEDVPADVDKSAGGILFHDQNNRSMESLMSDVAKNAMTHNLAVELLRKTYGQMEMALKEKVG